MGFYRKHIAVPFPAPGILALNAWVADAAGTNFSALVATGRTKTTAGKLSTDAIAAVGGGLLEIGFNLDDLVQQSLGAGVFESSDPTDGFACRLCACGLAIAKKQGNTTTTDLTSIVFNRVTTSGVTTSRTAIATMTGGPWLAGAESATPTRLAFSFTPVLLTGGSLELVLGFTIAALDTAELEVHIVPGASYLSFDMEGRLA